MTFKPLDQLPPPPNHIARTDGVHFRWLLDLWNRLGVWFVGHETRILALEAEEDECCVDPEGVFDYGLVTDAATVTEDYGSVATPIDTRLDYGSVTE